MSIWNQIKRNAIVFENYKRVKGTKYSLINLERDVNKLESRKEQLSSLGDAHHSRWLKMQDKPPKRSKWFKETL